MVGSNNTYTDLLEKQTFAILHGQNDEADKIQEQIDALSNTMIGQILDLKTITNKDSVSSSLKIYVFGHLNLITNKVTDIRYNVSCFEKEETHGYTNERFDNYVEAKKCFEETLSKYHVE